MIWQRTIWKIRFFLAELYWLQDMKIDYIDTIHATATDVESFEKMIGVDLPCDYKEFLLLQGGGVTKNDYIFEMSKPGIFSSGHNKLSDAIEYLSSF